MMAPLLVLALFAVVAGLIAWSRWLSGRRWAAGGNLLVATAAALAAGIGWGAARHLETYETLTGGQAIASIRVERVDAGRPRITLTRLPSGRMQVIELPGEEWRLAVRELGWTARAAVLGLKAMYRIESLDARDSSAADGASPVAVTLAGRRGVDLWEGAVGGSAWSAAVVPRRLTTEWQPAIHGERFEILLDGEGLAVERRGLPASAGEAAGR